METTYFRFEEVLPGTPAYQRYLDEMRTEAGGSAEGELAK
mgnify:CR=1 FL=1